jgi:quinol monooxygenase YgiN
VAAARRRRMYGTIMRARLKPGRREEMERRLQEWVGSDAPEGFHCSEVAFEDKDPNRLVMIVHFRDRASYVRNAERPETDSEYRQMLDHLDGEPEWIDVNYIHYVGEPLSAQTATAR